MAEKKEPEHSAAKDQENDDGSVGTKDRRHSNPLFNPERTTWQTVRQRNQQTRPPKETYRGGRSQNTRGASSQTVPHQRQRSEDAAGACYESRGRGNRGQRGGNTYGSTRGKSQVRGGEIKGRHQHVIYQSVPHQRQSVEDAAGARYESRGRGNRGQRGSDTYSSTRGKSQGREGRSDPVSLGFTQPDIRYEWNKLYVLGLHYRTSPDSVKNYIKLISGYDVKDHVDWFKPNGKAIVTLKTDKITDFSKILREARKSPLEGVNVLIERAPQCKSIFVSGFSVNTSKEQVQQYFEEEVGALDLKRGVVFNPHWDEDEKHKRAIVYFKDKKSVKRSTQKDHFLNDKPLHVEAFYPFLGTLAPVDSPKGSTRPTSSEVERTRKPEFYKAVNRDIMEFVMKSNQEAKLKHDLDVSEHARIKYTNEDGYVMIKYGGAKVDNELDENAWKTSCSGIIDSVLDSCSAREISVEEEILEDVADQLPQIERLLPKYTALVKLAKKSCTLKLICQKTNMSDFEDKLMVRLKQIKREELEKKLEQKKKTDIPCEKLVLLQNARIEDILKKEFSNQEIQAKVDLGGKSLLIKTPEGLMGLVQSYLKQRLDEIDHNAIPRPPEILEILKTKVGKRKMSAELPEGCAFNVDEKTTRVILLGRTPSETREGWEKTEDVLISDRSLSVNDKDNYLVGSEKWKDLCKKLEKRLKIRHKRELECIAVFGFKQDVTEAVNKMRDFLNEKKATEGKFRLDSSIHRRFFTEFYKEDLQKMEEELCHYAVKISVDDSAEQITFSGSEDGVKEVEERLYVMQDQIKEKTFPISTPGMRNLLSQEEGNKLIATVEREHKCIIEVTEQNGAESEDDESDDDEPLSTSSDSEEETYDNDETIFTSEEKRVIWKSGNIAEEQADILVCSVGSNFNLSIGAIANAMSKAAGPELQQALRGLKDVTADLGEGDIIHTGSGNLPCRYVIHCVCCPWKGNAEQEQILRDLLRKCFDKASELGACSIACPLIGTGNLGFPYATAVQIMIQAAVSYSQANPESPLEEFRFIVYSGDQVGITTFEEKFGEFKKEHKPGPRHRKHHDNVRKRNPTPAIPEFGYKEVNIKGLSLQLVRGDITEECSDAICNVVAQDLDMTSGNLSKAIADVCGSTVQEELRSAGSSLPPETVVITSAGLLSVKHIVHMVVGSGNKQHLQTCMEKALEEADSAGLRSVSLPAVGSGGLGLQPEDSAEVVFKAISVFVSKPLKSIREVRVVVFDDSLIGAFVNELEAIHTGNVECSNTDDKDEEKHAVYCKDATEASTDMLARCRRRERLLVHGHAESFGAAIVALKNGVATVCKRPHVIKKQVINRLPKRCVRDLKRMARDRDVKLVQPESDTIRLEGLPKDVMDMNTEVNNAIQEQREREHKEEQADQMSKTVQWYMVNASGKHEPFDKIANNEIESAYKANRPSLLFAHDNLKAEINFGNKEVTFLRNGRIKRVLRKDVLPLPVEWDPQPRDECGKEEILHLVSLAEESQEFKTVQEKFIQSSGGNVSITNIERIQNPSMFNSYMLRKQTMDVKNGALENELCLFHGTKYESVKSINVQGFNRSLCGQNGAAYGDGVYFAKEAHYSHSFSQPSQHGARCMYLARVLVGKYTAGERGMKTPPAVDPNKPEILYDSVVNTVDDPMIFVVFNDYHVYPEYLITFK